MSTIHERSQGGLKTHIFEPHVFHIKCYHAVNSSFTALITVFWAAHSRMVCLCPTSPKMSYSFDPGLRKLHDKKMGALEPRPGAKKSPPGLLESEK
eukprot:6851828-Prymnesium_polylepis.1